MLKYTQFWIGYKIVNGNYVFNTYFYEDKCGLTSYEWGELEDIYYFENIKSVHNNMNYRHYKLVERSYNHYIKQFKVMGIL